MPIVELSLSETTYTTLRQAAEQSNQPLAEMVEIALQAFLQPPTNSEPDTGNGSTTPAKTGGGPKSTSRLKLGVIYRLLSGVVMATTSWPSTTAKSSITTVTA
jgi:hypothetical protein